MRRIGSCLSIASLALGNNNTALSQWSNQMLRNLWDEGLNVQQAHIRTVYSNSGQISFQSSSKFQESWLKKITTLMLLIACWQVNDIPLHKPVVFNVSNTWLCGIDYRVVSKSKTARAKLGFALRNCKMFAQLFTKTSRSQNAPCTFLWAQR